MRREGSPPSYGALIAAKERRITAQIPAALQNNLPWAVILLASGIGTYFSLSIEGDPALTALALSIMTVLWFLSQKQKAVHTVITALLIVVLGYAAALYRTYSVKTPTLPETSRSYELSLKIEEISPLRGNRVRYIGEVVSLSKIAKHARPKRLRLVTPDKSKRFVYGDIICTKAVLSRPKAPLRPGGYDQGWALWFQKIGGSGFTIKRPELCKAPSIQPGRAIDLAIARAKEAIASRLDQGLAERERAIARALIIGDRGRIFTEDLSAIRQAGLGHLLAISGLHMVVFAGTLFFLVRAALACHPRLANQFPIKKWAALIALAGGGIYFLISGQSIPTQRAYIMIAIMFIAICLERPALTLRNVVIAAMLVLAFRPESLFSPGFQMSFAAVTALIMTYQISKNHNPLQTTPPTALRAMWQKPLLYLLGICGTSLVATIATAPFALYHFHQVSYLGPLGNMLAIPIFTFAVMPLVVLSLCAMPFGLEAMPLHLLSSAINALLEAAHWTASFKPAMFISGALTPASLALFTAAALLGIFLEGRQRVAALILLALAISLAKPNKKPDLYISARGDLMAVRGKDNQLHAPNGRSGHYALSRWLRADGSARSAQAARQSLKVRCDDSACSTEQKGVKITLLRSISALKEACAQADILIYKHKITRPCQAPKLIIARPELKRGGAHTIYIEKGELTVIEATETRRQRLWGKID